MQRPALKTQRPPSKDHAAGHLASATTPPDSLAFFRAVNESGINRGGLLHPVCGRNSGILAAWHALAAKTDESVRTAMGRLIRNLEKNAIRCARPSTATRSGSKGASRSAATRATSETPRIWRSHR